jgi:hypothetical protein
VLQPIGVAEWDGQDYGMQYELKFGRRRLRAARIAYGWAKENLGEMDERTLVLATIPVRVFENAGQVASDMWGIIENNFRKGNPAAEVGIVLGLIHKHGLSDGNGGLASLAKAIGKPKSYTKNLLATWGKLPDWVLDAVENDKVAQGVAKSMIGLPDEALGRLWSVYQTEGTVTAREVKGERQIKVENGMIEIAAVATFEAWQPEPMVSAGEVIARLRCLIDEPTDDLGWGLEAYIQELKDTYGL